MLAGTSRLERYASLIEGVLSDLTYSPLCPCFSVHAGRILLVSQSTGTSLEF